MVEGIEASLDDTRPNSPDILAAEGAFVHAGEQDRTGRPGDSAKYAPSARHPPRTTTAEEILCSSFTATARSDSIGEVALFPAAPAPCGRQGP